MPRHRPPAAAPAPDTPVHAADAAAWRAWEAALDAGRLPHVPTPDRAALNHGYRALDRLVARARGERR